MPSEEMPERIWLDAHSYNGAVGFAHPEKHKRDGWPAYIRADLCALTPAPQPEGQECSRCGSVGGFGCYECTPSAATPTAQEAVAWRCKDYADGWILYGNKAQAELYQACTGCLMEALYAHPPQPSETVAEALSGLMEAYKEIADSGDAGFWKAEETPEYQAAVAALRALSGGDNG